MSDKYTGAIALIMSQTNYTKDKAESKLKQWEGEYINVIKEYLNPKFQTKKTKKKKSVNEQMMYEIRNFMDDANNKFLKRKEEEKKKQEYLKKIYDNFLYTKKQYPKCKYDPPNILTCCVECKNPMCPGQLGDNNKYNKL